MVTLSKFVSFRPDDETKRILDDIPLTQKSVFIREAIKEKAMEMLPDSLSTRGPPGETSGVGKTAEASLGEPGAPGETESESWRSQSTSAGDKRSAPEPGTPQIASAEATPPQHAPGTGAPTVEEPKVPLDGSSSNRKPSSVTSTSPGRRPSNSSPTPTNAPKPPQSSEPSQLLTSLFSRGRC